MYGYTQGIDKSLTDYAYQHLLKRKKVVIKKKLMHFPLTFYSKLQHKLSSVNLTNEKSLAKKVLTKANDTKSNNNYLKITILAFERFKTQINFSKLISGENSTNKLPFLNCKLYSFY